jgi:hypothetical protein
MSNDSDMRFTFHSKKSNLMDRSRNIFENAAKGNFNHSKLNKSKMHVETTVDKTRNTAKFSKHPSLAKNRVSLYSNYIDA